MPKKNVREDTRDSQISGFSEFSKPQCSGKLINPNVPNSGFQGKSMFDSSDSESFYERLSKLNESLGYNLVFDVRQTKLNLHLFYKEVTLRGGFNQVNKDRRWEEIASSLKLDGRNLNYPDILLKLYALFLFHYEQIYFYRGPEKVASTPDLTIDIEDSPRMEMKCTNHSSQMVTNVEDGPGEKKILKESCSQSMSTGSASAEKQSAPEAEQKHIPQLHSEKEEIWTKDMHSSAENQLAVPEAAQEQTPQLHSKKKEMRKRGSASAEKQLAVPRKKGMKKPGARQGIRSGYHIFIKTECGRLKKIQSNKGQNLRQMANDAWNQLSEAEKQPFLEQSIKEKESFANKVAVDDEQNHVMESADLENKQASPDGDYHVILDPSDAEKSIEVN
ncbi:high mobility group B protein 10-like [Rosa rugosa]|uniref:high mobility group B protein 10-like n=1 Tax=Rosa rugosa TaxID=74645 RepID=UPI002B415CB0|nr:high mobility group B protein 10-like [Rosa rugosa]